MTADPLRTLQPGASDAELLHAIAGGSEAAFVQLRGRYARAVARVCRTVAGTEAEDCEQEVFARVWRKAALFRPSARKRRRLAADARAPNGIELTLGPATAGPGRG